MSTIKSLLLLCISLTGCPTRDAQERTSDAGWSQPPWSDAEATFTPTTALPGSLTLVAGAAGAVGEIQGAADHARIGDVIAIAASGNATYFFDAAAELHRMIDGHVETVTYSQGTRIRQPSGMVVNGQTLYVADSSRHALLSIDLRSREVAVIAGKLDVRGNDDGPAATATFDTPHGITIDDSGRVLVADTGSQSIRVVDIEHRLVTTFVHDAGSVWGLAFDSDKHRVFASQSNEDAVVAFDAKTGTLDRLANVGRFGVHGHEDGIGTEARMLDPRGLAFDRASSTLYVAEYDNALVRRIDLRTKNVVTVAGRGEVYEHIDGPGRTARFRRPQAIALSSTGHDLLVGDSGSLRAISIASEDVRTIIGAGDQFGFENGIGKEARFAHPEGIAIIGDDAVAVADCDSSTVRRIDLSLGVVSTLAGGAWASGFVDNSGTDALFRCPSALAYSRGILFVGDRGNNAIRSIDVAARKVTTVAGTSSECANRDGTLWAARLCDARGLAVSGDHLFVADAVTETIRDFDLSHKSVATIAGVAFVRGYVDGPAKSALFDRPSGIATISDGRVFIADSENHALRVFDPKTNQVSTFYKEPGQSVARCAAMSLSFPRHVSVFGSDVYVVDAVGLVRFDRDRNLARCPQRLVGTVGIVGASLGLLPGALNRPVSAAVLSAGDILLVDKAENVVVRAAVSR